jgi:guanylate kinase
LLFVISAPSGAGKTTVCRALRRRFPDLIYSVSHTTRTPRDGEREGVDYHFISEARFKDRIESGEWAEWARVHGHFYGTAAATIDRALAAGRDVLLDIDVQGARQIVRRYPECITIFILPPDIDTLRRRLFGRGTESADHVARRLKVAETELAQRDFYRHTVVNDRLEETVEALTAIFEAYRADHSGEHRSRR